MHTTQGASGQEPGIYLRAGVSERLRDLLGCESNSAVARAIGIDQSQFSRVASGDFRAGMKFVANLLKITRGKASFEDLFEVRDEERSCPPLRRAS